MCVVLFIVFSFLCSVLLMASSSKKCHVAVLLFPSSDTDSVLKQISGLSISQEVILKLLPMSTIPEAFSTFWECCKGFQKPVSPQCIFTTTSPLLVASASGALFRFNGSRMVRRLVNWPRTQLSISSTIPLLPGSVVRVPEQSSTDPIVICFTCLITVVLFVSCILYFM